jgi:hypothetical protein
MYSFVYIYMCIFINMYIFVYIYVYIDIYVPAGHPWVWDSIYQSTEWSQVGKNYLEIEIFLYEYVYIKCIYAYTFIYIYVYITFIYVYTYIYIYVYVYFDAHKYIKSKQLDDVKYYPDIRIRKAGLRLPSERWALRPPNNTL